jgi:hypothetical protein
MFGTKGSLTGGSARRGYAQSTIAAKRGQRSSEEIKPAEDVLSPAMAVTPNRWVSESHLLDLLARQGEAFDLDYKTILDIQNDPCHRLKLVKLVAAMTCLSGNIVVGVDGRGTPTGEVTSALSQVYDEANLRLILQKYLPPDLGVHSQTHIVDTHNVVLVHVEAGDGGPLALIKDGIYQDATNQPVYEFHTGERYIREGTSNAFFTGAPHQVACC